MRWIKYVYMVMCNRLERMGKVVLFFYHHREWVFGQGQERYISVPFYFFEKRNFLSCKIPSKLIALGDAYRLSFCATVKLHKSAMHRLSVCLLYSLLLSSVKQVSLLRLKSPISISSLPKAASSSTLALKHEYCVHLKE